jgi:nucleotide-binding universal stress UspA family protein
MIRPKNILVAVDADHPEQGALARAARLARPGGAALTLIAVVEDLPWYSRLVLPDAAEFQTLLDRKQAEALGRLAEPLRREGLAVSVEVLHGRPHEAMVRRVLRGGHDLLIKEAEPAGSVLFGSTDMHLLRACPCPVWLVKPGHGDGPLGRVLAPVDPAPPEDEAELLHLTGDPGAKAPALDAKVLGIAGALAEQDGAELHVLHVWSAPGEDLLRGDPKLEALSQTQVDQYVADSRAEAQKALDGLLARSPDPSGRRAAHLLKGSPAEEIAGFAKARGADLIVMGSVARTGLGGLLIGNTAESIFQRVDCSVLAVKPDGFVSPVAPG